MAENNVDGKKRAKSVEGKYKVYLGFIYKVNAKYRVIAENRITSSVQVIEPGIHLRPFLTPKQVVNNKSVAGIGSFEKFECRCKDGNEVYVDLSWNAYILDPKKLYQCSENPQKELESILKQGIKTFVNNKDYKELSGFSFNLSVSSTAEPEVAALKKALKAFEQRTGVRITNITMPDVRLTETQKKANEEKSKAKAVVEARVETAKGEVEVAGLEADAARLRAMGEGDALYERLVRSGMSPEQIKEIVIANMYANGRNNTIVTGQNSSNVQFTYPINSSYQNSGYTPYQNPYNNPFEQPYSGVHGYHPAADTQETIEIDPDTDEFEPNRGKSR